jgi:uncharacterized membrane-anchored protein YhcB (DUF1043 family)
MKTENNLYDIYTQWHMPFWQTRFFLLTITLLGAVVVGALIGFLLYRSFKKPKSAQKSALKELENLSKRPLDTPEQLQQAYYELTGILKNFLQRYYHLPFSAQSDSEIITLLKENRLLDPGHEKLQSLINSANDVKYAKGRTLRTEFNQQLVNVKTFVEQTALPNKKDT